MLAPVVVIGALCFLSLLLLGIETEPRFLLQHLLLHDLELSFNFSGP